MNMIIDANVTSIINVDYSLRITIIDAALYLLDRERRLSSIMGWGKRNEKTKKDLKG